MMEAQEVRMVHLEKIAVTTVETQTQILQLLKDLAPRVEEQAEILKQHTVILQEHSTRLTNLENRMENLEGRVANLERLTMHILEELVAIKEILAGPRGLGYASEPANAI